MYVNGTLVQSLRDSGSHVTLIDSKLAINNSSATCEPMTIQCAFGNVKCVKTCEIEIWSPKFGTDRKIRIKAGVIPRLGIDMITGHDLFVSNPDLKDPVAANNWSRQDDSLLPHPMTLIATRRRDYGEADRLRKAVGLQEDKTDSARTELCPSGDNYERRDECQNSTTNDESPSSKDETGARLDDVQVYDRNVVYDPNGNYNDLTRQTSDEIDCLQNHSGPRMPHLLIITKLNTIQRKWLTAKEIK